MITAVIGIGSNSVRMLVAAVADGQGKRLRRDREGTRLFAGLDQDGCLKDEAISHTVQVVARMAAEARREGAEQVSLFATSAVRDASNGQELAERLRKEARLDMEICSGCEEASLSFQGATTGEFSGVVDIGGGSTEIVTGRGAALDTAFSCQMGAVRLFRQIPMPNAEALPEVIRTADQILKEKLLESPIRTMPEVWLGTGGTFTTLAAMEKGVHWTERTYMHGTVLQLERIRSRALQLAGMPLEDRLQLPGLQPNRADIIVHGIAILIAVMERLGIQKIKVTEYGNLDGYLKRKYGIKGEIAPICR